MTQSMHFKSTGLFKLILEQLNDLRQSSSSCDITLIAAEKRIPAHKLVLACCSHYFKVMFTNERMIESQKNEIEMVDIGGNTLQSLVDFCYTAEITINEDNVQAILPAACLLQIHEVQNVCCDFLKKQLDVTNCLGIRAFADTHSCRDLFKTAEKYVLDNFQEVVGTDEFFQLTGEQICDIIANDVLNVASEEIVYKAVLDWIRYSESTRKDFLPNILSNVRLGLFNPKFLVSTVSDEPLIKANLKCRDLVDEAKNYLLLPSERADRQGARTKPRVPMQYGQLLYAVGGWCNGDALASVERMDARTGEWKYVAKMSKRRCGVGVAVLGDYLYAVVGHDGQRYLKCVERYDPRTNKWSSDVMSTKTCRTSVGVAVNDGYLYAVGGQDGVSCLNIVERYDPERNEWTIMAPMNTRRLGVSVSALDGCLYAVGGGADGNSLLNTVERYDPRINKWYNVKSMGTCRKHLGTAVLRGHLYAIGGREDRNELASGERYDPVKNKWTPVTSMNSQRSGIGLAVVNQALVAIGGFDGQSYLDTVEVYDDDCTKMDLNVTNEADVASAAIEDKWRYVSSMRTQRLGGGVGVFSLNKEALATCTSHWEETNAAMSAGGGCLADLGYDFA